MWVRDGEDARFSLELSAAVLGAWFLNGARLGEEEEEDAAGGRCSVQRHGTEHSLLIRGVRVAESGAQVTFVSSSVRDSATLHVEGEQRPAGRRAAAALVLEDASHPSAMSLSPAGLHHSTA